MCLESSKEIEKMFYQDSYEKKKTGSNVFRRTGKGSPYAKVKGGVRFAKNNFKKYEKNSRVNEYNLFEKVIPYGDFVLLNEDEQVEMMTEWLLRYSKKKIRKDMGIGEKRHNSLLKRLNIDKRQGEYMRLSEEEMDRYKQEIIPSHIFRSLQADLKFELVDYYQKFKGMTNGEIAKELKYMPNTFNTQKSEWRKEYEIRRGQETMKYDDSFLVQGLNEDEVEKTIPKKTTPTKSQEQESNNTFTISIDGLYDGVEAKGRINALGLLLSDSSSYKINIDIEEIQ